MLLSAPDQFVWKFVLVVITRERQCKSLWGQRNKAKVLLLNVGQVDRLIFKMKRRQSSRKLLNLLRMVKDITWDDKGSHGCEPFIQIYECLYRCVFWVAKTSSGNELKYLNSTFWKRKQHSELAFEQCIEYKPCCGVNRHQYYGMYSLQCIVLTAYPLESAWVEKS